MASAQTPRPAIIVTDDGSAAATVEVPVGQEIEVALQANPTTGYTWRHHLGDAARLRFKTRSFEPATGGPPRPVGAGGVDRFVFEAPTVGPEPLRFEYRRGNAESPVRIYDLEVTVTP